MPTLKVFSQSIEPFCYFKLFSPVSQIALYSNHLLSWVLVDLPEATKIGITLRGLHKLEKKICELVKQGKFEGVGSYDKLTTENLVYK